MWMLKRLYNAELRNECNSSAGCGSETGARAPPCRAWLVVLVLVLVLVLLGYLVNRCML